MAEDGRFDGMFLNVAQQAQGIEPLMDHLFSFLRRKTDFFSGASREQVEQLVMKSLGKQADIAARDEIKRNVEKEKKERAKKELAEKKARDAAAKKAKDEAASKASKGSGTSGTDDGVIELGEDGAFDTDSPSAENPTSVTPPSPPSQDQEGSAAEGPESHPAPDEAEVEDDNSPAPIGNGGQTDKYIWTQTLADLEVRVALPDNCKSRDLKVDFSNTNFKVTVKGAAEPLVNGTFHKRIIVDDSLWTLEGDASNRELVLTLQKDNKMEWWKCVLQGDPEINTQKVQPENSKLGDLDAETRQTVEKMMFDQRQKAQGLPSSDELQKQEMMKKFQAAHPELDFSNAKMN